MMFSFGRLLTLPAMPEVKESVPGNSGFVGNWNIIRYPPFFYCFRRSGAYLLAAKETNRNLAFERVSCHNNSPEFESAAVAMIHLLWIDLCLVKPNGLSMTNELDKYWCDVEKIGLKLNCHSNGWRNHHLLQPLSFWSAQTPLCVKQKIEPVIFSGRPEPHSSSSSTISSSAVNRKHSLGHFIGLPADHPTDTRRRRRRWNCAQLVT